MQKSAGIVINTGKQRRRLTPVDFNFIILKILIEKEASRRPRGICDIYVSYFPNIILRVMIDVNYFHSFFLRGQNSFSETCPFKISVVQKDYRFKIP